MESKCWKDRNREGLTWVIRFVIPILFKWRIRGNRERLIILGNNLTESMYLVSGETEAVSKLSGGIFNSSIDPLFRKKAKRMSVKQGDNRPVL